MAAILIAIVVIMMVEFLRKIVVAPVVLRTSSRCEHCTVLGGVIKEWKLGVAKQVLLKSGDPNVWKTKGIIGHYKPALVALSYGL